MKEISLFSFEKDSKGAILSLRSGLTWVMVTMTIKLTISGAEKMDPSLVLTTTQEVKI